MGDLDYDTRLRLIRFACAFAWADLELHPKERDHILHLMERLGIEAGEHQREAMQWLRAPPPADDLDPYSIPYGERERFVRECEDVIRADGVIHPEETEAMVLLKKILFGDAAAKKDAPKLPQPKPAPKSPKKKGA